jgi:hypothetical protein
LGTLFGFERIDNLLRESASVGKLAAAAQNFGQEDDISAIAITRTRIIAHPFTFRRGMSSHQELPLRQTRAGGTIDCFTTLTDDPSVNRHFLPNIAPANPGCGIGRQQIS